MGLPGEQSSMIGPYRILERIGLGGMGVVYRAEHDRSGEVVALKTVFMPQEGKMEGLRREIRSLARMHHPGIVRIRDEGLHNNVPWFAMEFLEGLSLRHVIRRLFAQPGETPEQAEPEYPTPLPQTGQSAVGGESWVKDGLPPAPLMSHEAGRTSADLERLLVVMARTRGQSPEESSSAPGPPPEYLAWVARIICRLCETLCFLHAEGVVHRDLKPDNIFLTRDGRTILMDFGLMTRFQGVINRESLAVEHGGVGTLLYMAPEQIRGDFTDARTDLYSLGCIVYELFCGQPPFFGSSIYDLINAKMQREPPPLAVTIPGFTAEISDLVIRLLAREPRERLGYADTVAATLSRFRAPSDPPLGVRPRTYLNRPRFVGRVQAMTLLEHYLGELQADHGRVVFVAGESGIGKTRLGMEAGRRAIEKSIQVLTGESLPGVGRPLEALRKPLLAIGELCRDRGASEVRRILGPRLKVLASYEPFLARLPGAEQQPDPVELPADEARSRLFSYLRETLAAMAVERPLLLILDDLHWADDLVRGFLQYLIQGNLVAGLPVLLLGLYRTDGTDERLEKVLRLPGSTRLTLEPLEDEAIATMVRDMLTLREPPRGFCGYLAAKSGGNPFFVAEFLQGAINEGLLWRDQAGRWRLVREEVAGDAVREFESLRLPASLDDLILSRLRGLPEIGCRVIEVAAVLGQEADTGVVQDMTNLGEQDLYDVVKELQKRHILMIGEGGEIRFFHSRVRDLAYGRIEPDRLVRLHRAVAEKIAGPTGESRPELAAELAYHWEIAQKPELARCCYLEAARRETRLYCYSRASRFYRTWFRLAPGPTPEGVRVRDEFGRELLQYAGKPDEALAEHSQALNEARGLGDRYGEMISRTSIGDVHWGQGHLDQAMNCYEEALAMSRELVERQQESRLLSNIAALMMEKGFNNEAESLYQESLDLARDLGNLAREGVILGNLATISKNQGNLATARELYLQAIGLSRRTADRRREGVLLGNLANLCLVEGHLEEAGTLYQQALDLTEEVGFRWSEALIMANLGILRVNQGDSAEGLRLFERSLTLARDIGNRRQEAVVLGNLIELCTDLGRIDQAREYGRQAEELARDMGDRRVGAVICRALASLSRRTGQDLALAEELACRSESLLADGCDDLNRLLTSCESAHIMLARGDDPLELLRTIVSRLDSLSVDARAETARSFLRLSRAVEVFKLGRHESLYRGELIADLPTPLRTWLIEVGLIRSDSSG